MQPPPTSTQSGLPTPIMEWPRLPGPLYSQPHPAPQPSTLILPPRDPFWPSKSQASSLLSQKCSSLDLGIPSATCLLPGPTPTSHTEILHAQAAALPSPHTPTGALTSSWFYPRLHTHCQPRLLWAPGEAGRQSCPPRPLALGWCSANVCLGVAAEFPVRTPAMLQGRRCSTSSDRKPE